MQTATVFKVRLWLAKASEGWRKRYDEQIIELARIPVAGDHIALEDQQLGSLDARVTRVILYPVGQIGTADTPVTVRVEAETLEE